MNDITVHKDFASAATDKVRTVLMDLIPEEQVTKLIEKEFKNYFEESGSGFHRSKSRFADLVEREIKSYLEEQVKVKVREVYDTMQGYANEDVAGAVKTLITECQKDALDVMVANQVAMSTNHVYNMMNNLQNNNNGY